jgi:hypothetical protein
MSTLLPVALRALVPQPQQVMPTTADLHLPDETPIYLTTTPHALFFAAERLQQALHAQGVRAPISAAPAMGVALRLGVDPAQVAQPQGYKLSIEPSGVVVIGHDGAGAFYGVCTLLQIIEAAGRTLPGVLIADRPDFPQRGIMLDVTRARVPTMATLYALVDQLAALKINQLQLYTEHAFAYRGHEAVWHDADPLTGQEILALDAYCRARFVELVPNQNSFGHMHRWLKVPEYAHLAEASEGMLHSFSTAREPFSLCPLDPGSLELIADLFAQLLPHFSSRQFNVGLDETFDLGHGRSQAACAAQGTGAVYLEFLRKIYGLCTQHGVTMQFWSDILVRDEPDLVAHLPHDVIALEWGYEADYPFDRHGAMIAASGRTFYVCPGTSSWNSLAGRTENALGNIRNAAIHGLKHGAVGMLTTDWGDNGHPQPLPVSYLGFLAAAAFGWHVQSAHDLPDAAIPALLDRHFFRDRAGVMGKIAYDLGNAYLQPGVRVGNSSPLFWLLMLSDAMPARRQGDGVMSEASLEQTGSYIDEVLAPLDQAQMDRPDAALIVDEYRWLGDLLRLSVRIGLARVPLGLDQPLHAVDARTRHALADDLRPLIDQHARLWCSRSRLGGLAEGLTRLQTTLAALEG